MERIARPKADLGAYPIVILLGATADVTDLTAGLYQNELNDVRRIGSWLAVWRNPYVDKENSNVCSRTTWPLQDHLLSKISVFCRLGMASSVREGPKSLRTCHFRRVAAVECHDRGGD